MSVGAATGPGLDLILTQAPAGRATASPVAPAATDFGAGGRIVRIDAGGQLRVLTEGFDSAADPDLSFDGRRMLFAGRRTAADPWNIYEMAVDGSGLRQITRDAGNCRQPVYQGRLYTIDSTEPWQQISFVSDLAGERNEAEPTPSTSLYTCRLDGSGLRRLTFNPSSDFDPTVLPDGRLLFSVWERRDLRYGASGRVSLFAAQIDGLDYALFAGDEGRRIKRMPTVTPDRLVVFVESDAATWDGAGSLATVSLRRNLHSYRALTGPEEGLFHSPSALADGRVLVSRRPAAGAGTHGIVRVDPTSGRLEPLFDDPRWHDVQAKALAPRAAPDGRSSVVNEKFSTGKLYCLDAYESDLGPEGWIARGEARRLRVLEGLPQHPQDASRSSREPPLLERRFLGEIDIAADGSFNVELPIGVPVELQLLDDEGMALRSCGWIWVTHRETRGCIGCHEDPERTPVNRFADALGRPSIPLTLPPERRRNVDFRRDVLPILGAKCATTGCHVAAGAAPRLDDGPGSAGVDGPNRAYEELLVGSGGASADSGKGRWVDPGRARTSPLIWHLYGRDTSRPWDPRAAPRAIAPMPPPGAAPLTDSERRTLVEWIDLGARWGGSPELVRAAPASHATSEGGLK